MTLAVVIDFYSDRRKTSLVVLIDPASFTRYRPRNLQNHREQGKMSEAPAAKPAVTAKGRAQGRCRCL